jgi:ABC-type transport system involved in multi-copper enzyme maturation permease subunit
MALVPSGLAWLRQRIGWSNSRQSWLERLAGLALLGGAGWALGRGDRLSATQHVVVWGLLLLAAAVLLRRGWLKLFGPVLFYDMIRSARRGRYFLVRCGYAGLLLFFLFSVWLNTRDRHRGNDRQQAADLAAIYFETFMAVQLCAVALLTPAYVAGAIAEEKDRKTLEFLLATDLRNREIVLSKLAARLANLTLFVLTGLPILSLIQFLGGVDPNLVLAGFAVTALTMAGLGGLSILISTYFKRPRDAIALTYLGAVAYLAVSFLLLAWQAAAPGAMSLAVWFGSAPWTVGDLVNAINSGNLLIVMGKVAEAGRRGTLATEIPTLLWHYAGFHGAVVVGLTAWSVARLRGVALKQAQGESRRRRWTLRLWRRPPVSNLPMLWKEVFVEGGIQFSWLGWILVVVLLAATLVPGVWIIGANFDEFVAYWSNPHFRRPSRMFGGLSFEMNIYVRFVGTVVACLTLLAVAVRASSSLGGERDRQTLDALLTSPLDSDAILFGKWLGAILSVRRAWLWLGLIWGMGLISGGLHLLAVPLLVGAWAVYAAFFATLGLWWSMVARTTLRATVGTLSTVALVSVGHWLPWFCCGPLLAMNGGGSGAEFLAKFQAGLTPPAVLAILPFQVREFENRGMDSETVSLVGFSLFGLFVWLLATVGLGAALSGSFRERTGRTHYRLPEGRRPEQDRLPDPEPEVDDPAKPPSLPPLPTGAILVDETWEKPRKPPGDDGMTG